jgi:hypothetical protein
MPREAVYAELPQKQAEVVLLYAALYDEAKPRETTKAVADHPRVTPATVRWHKAEDLNFGGFSCKLSHR